MNYVHAYQTFCNYKEIPVEEVIFGLYSPYTGKALVTAKMQWRPLLHGDDKMRFAAKLIIFDDAFGLLSHFKKLFETLSQEENKRIGLSAFCQLLKQHDFVDREEIAQNE